MTSYKRGAYSDVYPIAIHIAGEENGWGADLLSRKTCQSYEWELAEDAFNLIIQRWRVADIDMSASGTNRKCHYCITTPGHESGEVTRGVAL